MKAKVKQESEASLRRQIHAKIAAVAKVGICLPGTLVHKSRKCGNPKCACANGGPLHPACTVTSKVAGKTKAIYIPVDMIPEVETWVENHRRAKRLLKEIGVLAERLIRLHVPRRLAARRREESLGSIAET